MHVAMNRRLVTLKLISNVINYLTNFSHRRQNQDSDSITSEDLASWLKDNKILNVVFTDYLHLPQYVEKLDKILK